MTEMLVGEVAVGSQKMVTVELLPFDPPSAEMEIAP